MMLSDLTRDCLVDLAKNGASERTLDEYERIYRQFRDFVVKTHGADVLRGFDSDTCEDWVADLHQRGCIAATIRHKLSALSTLAKYAMRTKGRDGRERGKALMTENPTQQFRWPVKQRPRQDFLYPDELEAFLACARPVWERLAADLAVDTGLRRAELCRANVEDFVRLPTGYVLYVTVKGRGRAEEKVPIPVSTPMAAALTAWLSDRGTVPRLRKKGDPEPLLVTSTGERWHDTTFGEMIGRVGRAAGIRRIVVSPHRLRRTSNVVARHAGLDSLTRSSLLNHTDPSTIKQYDAVIPGELAKAREQARTVGLAAYLGKPAIGTTNLTNGAEKSA